MFMATSSQSAEEDIRLLDQLSGLAMAMAQRFQAQCLAAGEAREAADLALGFQRAARSVRQCIALKARLQWDAERREREARAEAEDARAVRAERRKAQVRTAVKRWVLDVHEGFDADNLLNDLEERLEEDALYGLFGGQDDINLHIARLCEEIGVPGPAAEEDAVAAATPVPPLLGEVTAPGLGQRPAQGQAPPTEGVRSDLGGPPHPLRGSSPSGGATEVAESAGDDPPRQSSA